jgi:hypothetical protein
VYLSERAGSADYGRYLGVTALAHRDLRDLDAFLRSAASDTAHPVERIVLYIDDLDRCPPQVVVNVLEAVHLLLALPLFVVVVGVDARWLSRSLLNQHPLLMSDSSDLREPHAESPASPVDYLDKIFQLSYELPPMTSQHCAGLLTHLALRAQGSSTAAPPPIPARTAEPGPTAPTGAVPGREAAAALTLGSNEIGLLETIAPLIGPSPRRAKRFLNVYRVVKARVLIDPLLQNRMTERESAHLMLLTALATGLTTTVPAVVGGADPGVLVTDWLREDIAPFASPPESRRLLLFLSAATGLEAVAMGDLLIFLPIVRRYVWPPGVAAPHVAGGHTAGGAGGVTP